MHESPSSSVRFISGGSHSAAKGQDFPPHKHTVWELVYYRTGHVGCRVGDTEYVGAPGLLLLTPPETIHAEIALTTYSNYYLVLEKSAGDSWPVAIYDDPSLDLHSLFASIVRELNGSNSTADEMLQLYGRLLALNIRRARENTSESAAERLIAQAESVIEERFGSPLRVIDIANEVGCATSTLRSHFIAVRGISPHAALVNIRMRHALGFIRNSTLTIAAVAEKCGFDSASHLTRHIKRATGKSPGALRNETAATPE